MIALVWTVVGLAALALSIGVGFRLGAVIARRDLQKPIEGGHS